MTPSQQRYYDANKDSPEFKARRAAAVKRYDDANKDAVSARKRVSVEPVVGERFEDWLQRWGELEGRALFAVLAAARHERSQKAAAVRKTKAVAAIDRVRSGKADGVVKLQLASWRQPGQFLSRAGLVTSVFDFGQLHRPGEVPVTPAGAVTPVQGAGAKRREGDAVHLVTDSEFKATTWRAPWAPGYALSGSGNT